MRACRCSRPCPPSRSRTSAASRPRASRGSPATRTSPSASCRATRRACNAIASPTLLGGERQQPMRRERDDRRRSGPTSGPHGTCDFHAARLSRGAQRKENAMGGERAGVRLSPRRELPRTRSVAAAIGLAASVPASAAAPASTDAFLDESRARWEELARRIWARLRAQPPRDGGGSRRRGGSHRGEALGHDQGVRHAGRGAPSREGLHGADGARRVHGGPPPGSRGRSRGQGRTRAATDGTRYHSPLAADAKPTPF